METYVPKKKDEIVVRMNREQLQEALDALDESGAEAIGIPLSKK